MPKQKDRPVPNPDGFATHASIIVIPSEESIAELIISKNYQQVMTHFETAVDQIRANINKFSTDEDPKNHSVMSSFFKPSLRFNSKLFKELIYTLQNDLTLSDNFKTSLRQRVNSIYEALQFDCKLSLIKKLDILNRGPINYDNLAPPAAKRRLFTA